MSMVVAVVTGPEVAGPCVGATIVSEGVDTTGVLLLLSSPPVPVDGLAVLVLVGVVESGHIGAWSLPFEFLQSRQQKS